MDDEHGDADGLIQAWFDVREVESGVFMIAEPLHREQVKSYLIIGRDRAILIDTGMGVGDIGAVVRDLTTKPVTVLNSHGHWDHVGGNKHFPDVMIHTAELHDLQRGYDAARMAEALAPDQLTGPLPLGFDPASAAIPSRFADGTLHGGEVFDLGGRILEVTPAPGHSPGLVVVLDRRNKLLFGTDAVYAGALYAQMKHSDLNSYANTLSFLARLAPNLRVVYSSHGPVPMDPQLIPAMYDAIEDIIGGRPADGPEDGALKHEFDGFSVLVPSDEATSDNV